MHYWECPPTPPHSDIFGRYILVLGTKPTWKKKSFQMHNSVNLLFLFSKPFTAGIWVTEILQAWITHCGPVAGIEVQCEDWRVQSQGCWRSQEDWAESVTSLFRAGDKLVGEGGGKAVLRRGIRRALKGIWSFHAWKKELCGPRPAGVTLLGQTHASAPGLFTLPRLLTARPTQMTFYFQPSIGPVRLECTLTVFSPLWPRSKL